MLKTYRFDIALLVKNASKKRRKNIKNQTRGKRPFVHGVPVMKTRRNEKSQEKRKKNIRNNIEKKTERK